MHPKCQHCKGKPFYDYDALYKHYRDAHFLCELCKKMGKKKKNKKTGLVEYEVYNDNYALHAHYKHKHHACKKKGCEHMAF